jgi:hypothetical protein
LKGSGNSTIVLENEVTRSRNGLHSYLVQKVKSDKSEIRKIVFDRMLEGKLHFLKQPKPSFDTRLEFIRFLETPNSRSENKSHSRGLCVICFSGNNYKLPMYIGCSKLHASNTMKKHLGVTEILLLLEDRPAPILV